MAQKEKKSPIKYWRDVMGGKYLIGDRVKRNIKYVVFILFLTIVYISSRYYCQQAIIDGQHLSDTLADRRYKALTASSQLRERTLRSKVERQLADSTIHTSTDNPYIISKQ